MNWFPTLISKSSCNHNIGHKMYIFLDLCSHGGCFNFFNQTFVPFSLKNSTFNDKNHFHRWKFHQNVVLMPVQLLVYSSREDLLGLFWVTPVRNERHGKKNNISIHAGGDIQLQWNLWANITSSRTSPLPAERLLGMIEFFFFFAFHKEERTSLYTLRTLTASKLTLLLQRFNNVMPDCPFYLTRIFLYWRSTQNDSRRLTRKSITCISKANTEEVAAGV